MRCTRNNSPSTAAPLASGTSGCSSPRWRARATSLPTATRIPRPRPQPTVTAIARNHPFIDGNERTAYVALELFLALNGVTFPASDAEATLTTLAMAAGDLDDPTFIAWVRRHAQPATSPG